jgi:hypothetical protein
LYNNLFTGRKTLNKAGNKFVRHVGEGKSGRVEGEGKHVQYSLQRNKKAAIQHKL